MSQSDRELRRRRWLLLAGVALIVVLSAVGGVFYRYVKRPAPLPELIAPEAKVNYAPHYLSSIYGVDKPVGVAVSPDGSRVYVAESDGERLVRIFDRNGEALGTLVPPGTEVGERAPVYVATDRTGRIYVTDRLQFAIFVYTSEGRYQDAILAPDLTLTGYASRQVKAEVAVQAVSYNAYRSAVSYQPSDGVAESLPLPSLSAWAPLGIRLSPDGTLLLTDVAKERNRVHEMKLGSILDAATWTDFGVEDAPFGASGQKNGEFLFPNSAVADSGGRIYVADSNNGRIAVWDKDHNFAFNFGRGTGDGALNLPRGLFIDSRDRLHVADAVGHTVRVYDVSATEPAYLYSFGDVGDGEGQFNYPNDIAIDDSGRLYVADRENSRVQVWSY